MICATMTCATVGGGWGTGDNPHHSGGCGSGRGLPDETNHGCGSVNAGGGCDLCSGWGEGNGTGPYEGSWSPPPFKPFEVG